MNKSSRVMTGQDLWQSILMNMDKTMMEDIKTSSDTLKTSKGNWCTVSLKSSWKLTFEWRGNALWLTKAAEQDVFARDSGGTMHTLSSVGILCQFAEKFRLVAKDKKCL